MKEAQELRNATEQFYAQPLEVYRQLLLIMHTYPHSIGCFPDESGYPVTPQFSSYVCSRREPLEIRGTSFCGLGVLSVTQSEN